MSADTAFLDESEMQTLTGRKLKSHQIAWLRSSGIPFWVNATGHAVVARSAVGGNMGPVQAAPAPRWKPRVVGV